MLDWLQNFGDWLASVIGSCFSFIGNLVEGTIDLFKSIPVILSFLTSSIANLPSVVIPFATAGIVLSIVLLVAGRQNNS